MMVPNIKPAFELNKKKAAIHCADTVAPIALNDGEENYLVYTLEDREHPLTALELFAELEKGRLSGEEEGTLSADEVRAHFRERMNER